MNDMLRHYREVWLVDFEFQAPAGDRPEPHCLVAREFRTGHTLRLWIDEMRRLGRPPFPTDPGALFVAYYASAELGCFLALDWPMPARILDLFCEFRRLTNGLPIPCGNGLLGALAYCGLPSIEAAAKDSMRELAIRGAPFSDDERTKLLDYCETDVAALAKLLPAILPSIDLPRALLRGRYMAAAARIEWTGIPIDCDTLADLRAHWIDIQQQLIGHIDAHFEVYDGRTFKRDRFAEYLAANGIPWPRLESGSLALSDDAFRDMAKSYPVIAPLRELRHTLGEMRLESLAVGADGRNRTLLSVLRSRSGRNQPSNSKFIFGPSCWLRGLIKPEPDRALAYVDWSQQEFGIAAALSGDRAMMAAYTSGDPYLAFAKQAGAVPDDATKESHGTARELFKTCALGVQYGMGEVSLAERIGEPPIVGRNLLRLHRKTYPDFWRWSQAAVDHAMLHGHLDTVFGWRISIGSNVNPRSLANFPMQANGADMLRLACCLATERGIEVCAPVHDALLVEGPARMIEAVVEAAQEAMVEASAAILSGFRLRSDATIVRWPDRFMDPRGESFWSEIEKILVDLRRETCGAAPQVTEENTPHFGEPSCGAAQHPPVARRNTRTVSY